jgi:hypothetical protein
VSGVGQFLCPTGERHDCCAFLVLPHRIAQSDRAGFDKGDEAMSLDKDAKKDLSLIDEDAETVVGGGRKSRKASPGEAYKGAPSYITVHIPPGPNDQSLAMEANERDSGPCS